MKFTQEQAFERLKSLLTNNGKKTLRMSEQSLTAQLETLIPLVADDETELDAFVEKVQKSFETMNSNAEKDRADFIKEYKKSNPPQSKNNNEGDDKPQTELEKRLLVLEQAYEEERKKNGIAEKKAELRKAIKKKASLSDSIIDEIIGRTSLTMESDIEKEADACVEFYNKIASADLPNYTPSASGRRKDEDIFSDIVEYRKQQAEQKSQIV